MPPKNKAAAAAEAAAEAAEAALRARKAQAEIQRDIKDGVFRCVRRRNFAAWHGTHTRTHVQTCMLVLFPTQPS
jgi:hypothetical protein